MEKLEPQKRSNINSLFKSYSIKEKKEFVIKSYPKGMIEKKNNKTNNMNYIKKSR